MPHYIAEFTGNIEIDAPDKEQATECFWANVLKIFEESNIRDVTIAEDKREGNNI